MHCSLLLGRRLLVVVAEEEEGIISLLAMRKDNLE